ncbi:MAG: heavy-metal-associated domain-containing protein [Coriobacteriales bacterium]|nr:heavy-metal-associated domain-containing protein [Coriobacteriales bacterium]
MEHVEIKVEGMRCPSCEKLVVASLVDLGAESATADHIAKTVTYDADPALVTPEAVAAAIADCGFKVVA